MLDHLCFRGFFVALLFSMSSLAPSLGAAAEFCSEAKVIKENWEIEGQVKTLRFRFSNRKCGLRPGDAVEIHGKGVFTACQKRIYSLSRIKEGVFSRDRRRSGADLFEVTFKVPQHNSSSSFAWIQESPSFDLGFFLKNAHPGDRVALSKWSKDGAPLRLNLSDLQATEPLVLIAGGLGITPFMSAVRYLDQVGLLSQRKVLLVYSFSKYSDLLFQGELESLQARYPGTFKVFAHPTQEPGFERLTSHDLSGFLKSEDVSPETSDYWICGSRGFAEAFQRMVLEGGGLLDRVRVSGQ